MPQPRKYDEPMTLFTMRMTPGQRELVAEGGTADYWRAAMTVLAKHNRAGLDPDQYRTVLTDLMSLAAAAGFIVEPED